MKVMEKVYDNYTDLLLSYIFLLPSIRVRKVIVATYLLAFYKYGRNYLWIDKW